MPKRKDKSFELMASIGEAKKSPNSPIEAPETPKKVKKPAAVSKTAEQAVETQTPLNKRKPAKGLSTSNIPYVPASLDVKKQLRRLAFEEETSMTALISEGLDYVFKDRGLKSIDQLTKQ